MISGQCRVSGVGVVSGDLEPRKACAQIARSLKFVEKSSLKDWPILSSLVPMSKCV